MEHPLLTILVSFALAFSAARLSQAAPPGKKNPAAEAADMTALAAKLSSVKGNNLNGFLEVLYLVDYLTDDWYSFGQYVQLWEPTLYTEWNTYNAAFDVYDNDYDALYDAMEVADWAALDATLDLADATADLADAEADLAAADALLASYSPESATDDTAPTEPAVASDDIYDAADDDDGDGLDDADDPDDDGDGIDDDDADGDGTPDDADDDDDNDGTPDSQDDDADGGDDDGGDDDGDDDDGDDDDGGDDDGGDDDGGDDGGDE
ncbi:hypothetical protein BH18VER1_BH18VER1_02700 [soil metagenome]